MVFGWPERPLNAEFERICSRGFLLLMSAPTSGISFVDLFVLPGVGNYDMASPNGFVLKFLKRAGSGAGS